MWDVFDTEVGDKTKGSVSLECIYRECGDRECCDQCSFSLAFSDEGFLTCTNPKCGIIYKDTTDQTAEWRYYGADDNQSGDPTRCGMPINPLLKESSYGCKVLCTGHTSYEMRKFADILNGNQCHTKRNLSMTSFKSFILWLIMQVCQSLL